MSALVSISPDDLDTVESFPVTKAISNLAGIHRLPRLEHLVLVDTDDGRTIVALVLPEIAAEAWRRALGAAPFTEIHRGHYSQHKTDVFWFGATVRLSYTSL